MRVGRNRGQYTSCAFRLIYHDSGHLSNGYTVPGTLSPELEEGWIVAPEDYVRPIDKLAQNLFLAAPTPAQHAALAAFRPETLEILDARCEAFRERRDFLLPALRELGFGIPVTPEGAFYIYADSTAFDSDSQRLAERLLEEAGVAITPGLDFGHHRPEAHVRFAYTREISVLEAGVERLREALS
jgi:aspartate/methionine/tyrosine aminotransferase